MAHRLDNVPGALARLCIHASAASGPGPVAGAGAVVAGGVAGCCSLVHLHLGNACFPKASTTTWDLTWGHRALAALLHADCHLLA